MPAARLSPGLDFLKERYEVVSSAGLLSRTGYLAGDDGRRLAELRWALSDPSIKGVFCARGGYGLLRSLPALCAVPLAERRAIPLIGFSDITVLHAWAAQADLMSVHGPVITQLGDLAAADREALIALVEGGPPCPAPLLSLQPLVGGRAWGRLIGGNLEVLSRLCGTPLGGALLQHGPVILLLEEVGERPYRIDRALTQLLHSGLLDRVVGVVIGDLIRCAEPDGTGPTALEVIVERLLPLGGPIVAGAPIGHGARNRAVLLGARVELDGSAGTLLFLSP